MTMIQNRKNENFLLNQYLDNLNAIERFQWELFDTLYRKLKQLGHVKEKVEVYSMQHRLTDFRAPTKFLYRGCIMLDHPKDSIILLEYNYEKLTISTE